MASIEKYTAPETLEEVTDLLAEGYALMFAGGTDVMPQTRSGVREFQPYLINIARVAGIRGISREGSSIRIGALTTLTDILESALLKEHAPVLVAAADCFASGQVRNSATLGGNLCNASPAADMAIPLLLLDAEVELQSGARRCVPLSDFFLGPGKTWLNPTEILTHVRFDAPPDGFRARFVKFGVRPALDISVVSVGVAGVENAVFGITRVAFGAAAPTPLRGEKTEAFLEGRLLDEDTIAAAAGIAQEEVSPISDVRGSAWYRRELVRTLTERALRDVA
ncbi:MAG: xanthine dehydrogenase family protein subunit M [Vicinamibacteria bacterium]